jgi:hypothetical protein
MLRNVKRIRSIFVAYPYLFGQPYRDALAARFSGTGVEFRYADDMLLNGHVMDKIRRMMSEVDVSFFDVTGNNPNVMFELGYALGADEPGFVVVQEDAVQRLSADITGWDQLRYSDYPNLAELLHERVSRVRVPQRRGSERIQFVEAQSVRDRMHVLRFGLPAVDEPLLCIYAVPTEYERYYKARSSLGTPPYRAQDLCESVLAGPNVTRHQTYFWPSGFSYDDRPGPDFVEVYDGRNLGLSQTERETNFRVYTSGTVTYMQRLRYGGAENKPFLYRYMFENIVEMALVAIADARHKWGFDDQGELNVGALFLHAADLRVSKATPGFYPAGDAGSALRGGDELWIPDEPIPVGSSELGARAKTLADEMSADLGTKVQ